MLSTTSSPFFISFVTATLPSTLSYAVTSGSTYSLPFSKTIILSPLYSNTGASLSASNTLTLTINSDDLLPLESVALYVIVYNPSTFESISFTTLPLSSFITCVTVTFLSKLSFAFTSGILNLEPFSTINCDAPS